MDINELTIGQAKELSNMFGGNSAPSNGLNKMVGGKCIIRTYSAGVWFGEISEKCGKEVIVKNARRLWYWKAKESISLSAVALYGLNLGESKVCQAVDNQWLEAIELIPCTEKAIKNIEGAKDVEAS